MFVRGSSPCRGHVRSLRSRLTSERPICILCTSRSHATFKSVLRRCRPLQPQESVVLPSQLRNFVTSNTLHHPQSDLGRSFSPLDDASLYFPDITSENTENVRTYLKQWSTNYRQSLRDNAPDQVHPGLNPTLPNSLFTRDAGTKDDVEGQQDERPVEEIMDQDDELATTSFRSLRPGDAFIIRSSKIKTQFAMYLGPLGLQSQFLLENGCWFVDTQTLYGGHIIHGFATEEEMAPIRALMPVRSVEFTDSDSATPTLHHASGELPFHLCASILSRFSALAVEAEQFRREHGRVLEDIYKVEAPENEFKVAPLRELVKHHLRIDFESLTKGALFSLSDMLFSDERFIPQLIKDDFSIVIIPQRLLRHSREVIRWARSYQDAAARATAGKDVSTELRNNPLTNFISKARRLISRSRKIRLPTVDGLLGPTIKAAQPESGQVVRKATGEEFTEDEKKIIELIWHTDVRNPKSTNVAVKRNQSVCALILRAVGAYPDFVLDHAIGKLFLQELGCLDPWYEVAAHNATLPLHFLGLNHSAKVLRDNEQKALALLNFDNASQVPPFPDTLATLRKDWGDLEAFAIDSAETRLVDDAISIEASDDNPGHYWIHIHVAHVSAFIPWDHPFHNRARSMVTSYYNSAGSEPYMPWEVLDTLSISNKRPSYVLTCSTLLDSNGRVKDVQVQPGLLRNVVRVDKQYFYPVMNLNISEAYGFTVGKQRSQPIRESSHSHNEQQAKIMRDNVDKFKLIQELLVKRWDSRNEENPHFLAMWKMASVTGETKVSLPSATEATYDRLFRSEHCYGDPSIDVSYRVSTFTESTTESTAKHDVVSGSMLLASESFGFWTRNRNIPVIYRYQKCRPNFPVEKLNTLGPHEPFLAPTFGESVSPSQLFTMNLAQYAHNTSPLRKYKDLLNQYQVDAYIKAEAAIGGGMEQGMADVEYPCSATEMARFLQTHTEEVQMSSKSSLRLWTELALFRAFHFNEAKLPDVWEVVMPNPVLLGSLRKAGGLKRGVLTALGLTVFIAPSKEGYEKRAAFRQFLPVKLHSVDYRMHQVKVVAVGPPTNESAVKGYPELALTQT